MSDRQRPTGSQRIAPSIGHDPIGLRGCAGSSCWRTLVRVITRSDSDQRLAAILAAARHVSDHKRTAIAQVSDARLACEMVSVECAIQLYRRRAIRW
jgi:hypothetical protein